MATDADTVTAMTVTTAAAAQLAGVSPRTIRRWIQQGWLPSVGSENGHLVFPADLPAAAARAQEGRRPTGHPGHQMRGHGHDRGHEGVDTVTATTAVAARGQLDAIMQDWLAPLVDRIATLEREHGRLEAERDAARDEVAQLRRRAEAAEVERDSLQAVVTTTVALEASGAAPGAAEGPHTTPTPLSRWQRLWRALRGE